MPRIIPRSLRARLIASVSAISLILVGVVGVTISSASAQALRDQYLATYQSDARTAFVLMDSVLDGSVPLRSLWRTGQLQQAAHFLSDKLRFRVRIYLDTPVGSSLVGDSGVEKAQRGGRMAVDVFPARFHALNVNGLPVGHMVVSQPLTTRSYVEHGLLITVVWIAVAAAVVAVLVGSAMAARLTAPYLVLTRAAARLGAGNLGDRVALRRSDEAGDLALQFNRMAERLEASFATISAERDRLRQFVADVSHELRTPLTALRTFNDLLAQGADADVATRGDFLAESARQIERLDWLTHNLLDLSRLDAGIATLTRRPSDVGETTRRAVDANRPMAAQRGIQLVPQIDPVIAAHDRAWLEQALSNVVGNAIKFSPDGAAVRVRTRAEHGRAMIEVRDEGPGIPSEEVPHIFERFYRGRAANRAGEGSGLGLAIARAVVEAHHGTIDVLPAPDHGTIMRVSLPQGAEMAGHEGHSATPPAGSDARTFAVGAAGAVEGNRYGR